MLSHPVSSPCHFFAVSAQIPQLLQKFEKVRTLWTLKGLLGRIVSHKMGHFAGICQTIFDNFLLILARTRMFLPSVVLYTEKQH